MVFENIKVLDNEISKKEFINSIETFIFDADGVLYRTDHAIEGAAQSLSELRRLGKKIRFVTNNSTKTRQQFMDKLKILGFECELDEIYGSSYGCALYLKQQLSQSKSKVYIIGEHGLEKELIDQSIDIQRYEHTSNIEKISGSGIDNVEKIQVEGDVSHVVIGMDTSLNFHKLCYAHKAIVENKATFIATNTDSSYPIKNGKTMPGSGSIVSMVHTSTGVSPLVIGKPEPLLLDIIINRDSLDRSKVCMVGDRMNTDILFGVNGNIKTLLVYTGIEKEKDIKELETKILNNTNNNNNNIKGINGILDYLPNYSLQSIGDLFNK